MRASQRWTWLLALVFYVLMPAVAAIASLHEGTDGKSAPDEPPPAAVKADEPPPLRFDHKPKAGPPITAGSPGDRWAPYAMQVRLQVIALVKPKLDAAFKKADSSGNREFNMTVALWIGEDGRIDRVRLDRSSGNPAIDAVIDGEVRARLILPHPPNDMPQPVKVQIGYHGAFPMGPSVSPRFNLR